MLSNCRFFRIIATVAVAWSLGRCPVFGAALKTLSGHVPTVTSRLPASGRVPATNQLHLAIGVPLRDPAGLDQFLAQVSDPASPNFRNYLTPEIFTARFGPTEEDYAAVQNFARTNGLTIVATHGNRLLLDVAGPAAAVERAFHISLRTYRHPTENRIFFAPDTEPAVDAAVPVLDVSGLNDFAQLHPNLRRQEAASRSLTTHAGSGSGGAYQGDDFRTAYVPGTPLTGAGQMVGLVQFDGFYASDIATYAALAGGGRTNIVIQTILLDGFSGTPTTGSSSGNPEVSLDIEMAMAMAPGLAKIVVFEAPNNTAYFNDILNAMATNYLVKNLSTSWGGGSPNATSENIFKQLAAQGQSFFNATGDSDAFTGAVPFPSESVNITQVGGTTLTTGTGAAYASETVWNRGGGVGSSGGISTTYAIPTWQQGLSMAANGGSTTMRNIPDVALTAENVEVYYGNGTIGAFGGTSCAAPLWAGLMALVNQQAAAAGRAPVGFANPSLYAIARGANFASCFHDTTTGNNFSSSSPSLFVATTGYDLCTGWGTPTGTNLINALVGLADTWGIFPAGGLVSSGNPGGPFTVTSQIYTLTNSGAAAFSWQLSNTPAWLTVSPTNGVLVAGGQTAVTVSLNSSANNLAIGSYHADLIFSNQTTSVLQLRPVDLQVVSPNIVQNGGFETGSFSSWTLVGLGVSGHNTYNAVVNARFSGNTGAYFIHSGTYGAFMGDNTMATLSQTLTTVPGQSYLLSFWLSNPMSGAGEEFLVNWNGSQIYFITNPPVLGWTNLTFIVNATSTSTALQFGAANPPDGFGLDDISVIPLPSPMITLQPTNLTVLTGNTATFSANASGATPLSFQWLKNGINLANGTGISGATTNVLTLAGVTTNSAGNYSLVVTNAFGVSTSSVAALTIVLPPTLAAPLPNPTIECGSNISFTVTAAGTPPLSFQWSLDGSPVPGATSSSLTLTNVHLPNHTVTLVVTNLYAGLTSNAVLTVHDTTPPVVTLNGGNPITLELGSLFTDPGAMANDLCAGPLSVSASGSVNPNAVGTNVLTYSATDGNGNTNTVTRTVIVRDTTPPTILWSFTNLMLAANANCVALMNNVTGTNFILATDASGPLTISQSPTNNFILPLGTNTVVIAVADAYGNMAFSTNIVIVRDVTPPEILTGPQSQTNTVGTTVTFSVAATACTGISFQWFFNGSELAPGTNSTLILSNLTTAAAGNYSVAVNAAGGTSTSAVAVLTVNLIAANLTLNSSANPSGYNGGLNFTAAISPASAGGTVVFFTNSILFDTETVVAGQAVSASPTSLPRGPNLVTAVYSGDANDSPATNTLVQIVTNHPPSAVAAFYQRNAGFPLAIPVASLAANWSDVDGDLVSLADLTVSTNGVTLINNAGTLVYFNSNSVADQFVCAITDGWGGTNFQTVNLAVLFPSITGVDPNADGTFTLSFAGAPGGAYVLEAKTNLFSATDWEPVATNTLGTNGVWQFNDAQATNFPKQFYRLKLVQ